MTLPRSSLLVIACILQLMVFSGNAATLDTASPKPNCSASNFQLPEREAESHVVIHPLGKIYKADGLTISFAVKIMKLTNYPTALSYVFGSKLQFTLELPGAGSVSRVLKQNHGFWMTINGVRLGKEHPALPLDKWFQITAIWNGDMGTCTIYKDGVKVVESQNDDFMTDFKKGGSFVIGQEPPRFRKTSRLIGSVMELRVWPEALEGDELNALLDGDFSVNIGELVDVPATYELELKNGSRCDRECAPGKFIIQHSALAMKCQDCPPGQFSKEKGSSKCLPCPPGNFSSSSGGKNCPACAIGTYQDEQGMKECKKCKADFFTIEVGNKICMKCPEQLPAINAPTFRQCLDGKLALIAAAGTARDEKMKQDRNQNMARATASDKEIGKLKERHCESGEVQYPDNAFKVNREVRVNFRTKFSRTPSVTMAASRAEAFDIYKGLPFDMEPRDISTTGFTALMNIFMVGSSRPVLHAWWMACSSGGS